MNTEDINKARLLKIKEAAHLLGVHPATLRRWDKLNKLKAVRIGSRRKIGDRRYRLDDIKKLMEN